MLIIECNRCGGLLLSSKDQKTKTCIYCGTIIMVYKSKKLGSAKNAYEAAKTLRKFKTKKRFSGKI
jgi:DNA-directed RNA polymerase subunit M/transcription elongation factor TFIIS